MTVGAEEVILQGEGYGRIWHTKPEIASDGLISTISCGTGKPLA
jgi:hypothetical protein